MFRPSERQSAESHVKCWHDSAAAADSALPCFFKQHGKGKPVLVIITWHGLPVSINMAYCSQTKRRQGEHPGIEHWSVGVRTHCTVYCLSVMCIVLVCHMVFISSYIPYTPNSLSEHASLPSLKCYINTDALILACFVTTIISPDTERSAILPCCQHNF